MPRSLHPGGLPRGPERDECTSGEGQPFLAGFRGGVPDAGPTRIPGRARYLAGHEETEMDLAGMIDASLPKPGRAGR
jgi:hypothetical protein